MSLPLPERLADDLVRLRGFEAGDAAAVFTACRDPLIRRFTTFPEARDPDEVRTWIESQPGQRERGEALDLAVTAAGDRRVLGAVGLAELAPEHRRARVGYWLERSARGKGFASSALRLLTDWAMEDPLGLTRVETIIDVENAASARTAERAGFVYEGTMRSYLFAKGRRWDVAMYALVDPARAE